MTTDPTEGPVSTEQFLAELNTPDETVVTRRTLLANLHDMQRKGWVRREGDVWKLTRKGRRARAVLNK